MIVRLPMTPPNVRAVNSLRELKEARRQEAVFESQQGVRQQATDIADACKSWVDRAATYNQGMFDYATHDPNLAVLERVKTEVGNGVSSWYGELSGEVRLNPEDGSVVAAQVEVEGSKFGYRKTKSTETFTQVEGGVTTKVIYDHAKNLLTWHY